MNVQVKLNDTDITSSVISYTREHKICTSIGTLDVTIDRGSGLSFSPWDSVKIFENGNFKVEYYVSDFVDDIPAGTFSVRCQDNSKRLVDYFISESYTIDYPSYTRYWIEKFLDDAGVNYEFTTDSQGNLLSNFTALGMATAYEQIIQLLQLSGWYMYFNGNGKAIIGKFNQNLSPVAGRLNEEDDILDISVIQDDKMLRNRVVVLGAYDPIFSSYATADISVNTPWNYDSKDKRSIVISNSNIPNRSSAYGIANQLIKEFSRITVEKHILCADAKDFSLGDVLKVSSRAYNGKGIVTTYGTNMDSGGLTTSLILDERCPRLFGYFNFGDYVYVSTFGDGIWRKLLQYDHTWHDFSDGLDQLAITDLHISNGLFTSVGTSGEMYYNLSDDTAWSKLEVESLLSVPPSGITTLSSGETNQYTYSYSGIMGRATILDRDSARILYAVDNASGINYGDYKMMLSGIIFSHQVLDYSQYLYSGQIWSGGVNTFRGWILEYDPVFDRTTSSPIHVSGNYTIKTFDIETDGRFDYVSVYSQSGVLENRLERDWGFIDNTRNTLTEHNVPFTLGDGGESYPYPGIDYDSLGYDEKGLYFYSKNQLITYSGIYEGDLKSDFLLFPYSDPITLNIAGYVPQESGDHLKISTRFQITGENIPILTEQPHVYQVSPLVYDIYIFTENSPNGPFEISKWTADFHLGYESLTDHGVIYHEDAYVMEGITTFRTVNVIRVDDLLYIYRYTTSASQSIDFGTLNAIDPAKGEGFLTTFDLATGIGIRQKLYEIETPEAPITGYWRLGTLSASLGATRYGDPLYSYIFMKNDILYLQGLHTRFYDVDLGGSVERHLEIYELFGPVGSTSLTKIFETTYTPPAWTVSGPYFNEGTHSRGTIATNWGGYLKIVPGRETNYAPHVLLLDGFATMNFTGDGMITNNLTVRSETGTYGVTWSESNQKFFRYHFASNNLQEILPPEGYEKITRFYLDPVEDTVSTVYVECTKIIDENEIKGFVMLYDVEENKWYDDYSFYFPWNSSDTISSYRRINNYTAGNWFINFRETGLNRISYLFSEKNLSIGSGYFLLQKNPSEDNYLILERSNYPIRVDVSSYSPILSVTDKYTEFNTISVFVNTVESISPLPTTEDVLSGIFITDYRYTLLPEPSGGVSKQGIYIAGIPLEREWLATLFSGIVISGVDETNMIRTFDLYTYSGIENSLNVGYNGILNRVETTNYAASGQYIFVTSSGDTTKFYQKDALQDYFVYYSGLPSSRATMIRIDDRL